MSKLNPKTTEPDFFGAPGALAISIGLPLLINVLYFACNKNGCPTSWTSLDPYYEQLARVGLFSLDALYAYLAWFFGLMVLDRIVPGEEVWGTVLRDGSRLKYKFNGSRVMFAVFALVMARLWYTEGTMPEFVFLYDHLLELANVAILFSIGLATYSYIVSFCRATEPILAEGGNTGNVIFDWFIGRELNTRIGDFDVKVFCEMRPGMILWVMINVAMAHHQYITYGYVSDSMVLVCLFQGFYVVEGTFYEKGLLSMIDVTTDGFGFMLSFGDLALLPFTYTMPARFLADHPVDLGVVGVTAIVGVFLAGLLIFRLSNNEKAAFKRGDSSTKHLKYIQSPTGSKLIISGWWGTARHINYFGDWLIAWAYSLPTGLETPIPYYFVVFFAVLLIHREMRDEAKCAAKYKETWKQYKKLVPWRIIPGIY
jgi:delta14-sterol reductase